MSPIAFGLKAEYDNDDYLGGVLAVGNTSLNVRDALEAGDGRIEVADDDYTLAAVLHGYPPLQVINDDEKPARKARGKQATPEPELTTDDNPSQED